MPQRKIILQSISKTDKNRYAVIIRRYMFHRQWMDFLKRRNLGAADFAFLKALPEDGAVPPKAQAAGGLSYGILRAALPPAAPCHWLFEKFQLIILRRTLKIGSNKGVEAPPRSPKAKVILSKLKIQRIGEFLAQ